MRRLVDLGTQYRLILRMDIWMVARIRRRHFGVYGYISIQITN
jgi:hypothetical protein